MPTQRPPKVPDVSSYTIWCIAVLPPPWETTSMTTQIIWFTQVRRHKSSGQSHSPMRDEHKKEYLHIICCFPTKVYKNYTTIFWTIDSKVQVDSEKGGMCWESHASCPRESSLSCNHALPVDKRQNSCEGHPFLTLIWDRVPIVFFFYMKNTYTPSLVLNQFPFLSITGFIKDWLLWEFLALNKCSQRNILKNWSLLLLHHISPGGSVMLKMSLLRFMFHHNIQTYTYIFSPCDSPCDCHLA